jgi:Na+:H+ antiporter, NhaA family
MAVINLNAFKDFLFSKSAGGIILIVCVIISLAIANLPIAETYENLLFN